MSSVILRERYVSWRSVLRWEPLDTDKKSSAAIIFVSNELAFRGCLSGHY